MRPGGNWAIMEVVSNSGTGGREIVITTWPGRTSAPELYRPASVMHRYGVLCCWLLGC